MMNRRTFLLSGAALLAPGVARAQRPPRIVVLTPGPTQWSQTIFLAELERLGQTIGKSVVVDVVSAAGRLDRLPALAREIVDSRPHLILPVNTPCTSAVAAATSAIPVLAGIVGDPVGMGFARTIARPGGNITGVSNLSSDITSKRTALLLELVPGARRIALFLHPDDPVTASQLREVAARSGELRIETRAFPMRNEADLRTALDEARVWSAQGMVRLAGQSFAIGSVTGRLATQWRIPSMMTQRSDVAAGGLMSYFADHDELWRRAAAQAHAILGGQAPSEIPFELPTKFELSVNLKTARTLGLAVPPAVLIRADEAIE